METDCCYRCGKIGHHRQGCTAKVSKDDEYKISRLCKRIYKESQISGSSGMKNSVGKSTSLRDFPVSDYL